MLILDFKDELLPLLHQIVYHKKVDHLLNLAKYSQNSLTRIPENQPIKIFSQNDEDGIIARIFDRIGKDCPGSFLEFGVDQNMECNSLSLLYGSWRGIWVDQSNHPIPISNPRLQVVQEWVSLDSLNKILDSAISFIGESHFDFLSIDLDGNDLYILRAALERIHASVICVEYNAHYVPPSRFCIEYNPDHKISGDYYGASLQSFVDLLANSHVLVATNLTGVNAFFVEKSLATYFPEACSSVLQLYTPPRYYTASFERIHPIASESIKRALGY